MLAVVPESFEKAWCGPDDDDLRTMLRDLERVHLPNSPQNAFNRVNLIERIQNCLDALKLDHLRVFKEIEKADPQGIETASDLLSHRLHLRPEAAYAQVRTATQLEEFPTLDRFVHEGALTQEATSIMLRTLRRFRKHLSPEDMAEAEGEMLVAAREMDPRQLKDHGSDLLHRYNRKAHNDELREEREKRFFDLRRRWDGWFSCEGYLDPEGGTYLQTALKAIAGKKKPEDDDRTAGQVRADALSSLAQHRLDFGDLPERGQEKPHLTIVVNAETLRGDEHTPAAQIDWGTPVSGETAKRLACDAIARIAVIGDRGDGITDVLHMGRAFRTTTTAQRKALDLQDGGCIWCGRHQRECTPHHWEAWSLGGKTDHENMGLVCPRHHFAFHEGGYRVAEVRPNRVVILRPNGGEYLEVPRHRWLHVRARDGTG